MANYRVVAIGADHGGVDAKAAVIDDLKTKGLTVIDEGTDAKASCDYPVYAEKVANDVAQGKADFGILICNSGEGMAIAANKVPGVRAAILYDDEVAHLAKEHNHANVITFGAKFMATADIIRRVGIYMGAEMLGDRHERRVNEIVAIEKKHLK